MSHEKAKAAAVSEKQRQWQIGLLLKDCRMVVMEKDDELPEETEGGMEADRQPAKKAEPD